MKFTLNNDLHTKRLIRALVGGLLVFILLFLAFDLLFKSTQYGTDYYAVHTALFGNEEEFIDPLSFSSLLEALHADTFFAMMTLLTVVAVYGRVVESRWRRVVLINIAMISALAAILSPLMAYYLSELFIWTWLASVCAWHLCAAIMAFESLVKVHRL